MTYRNCTSKAPNYHKFWLPFNCRTCRQLISVRLCPQERISGGLLSQVFLQTGSLPGTQLMHQLESLTRYETSSTACLRLYSDGSSICYSTVTLNCDLLIPKFNAFITGVSLVKIKYFSTHRVYKPRKCCFFLHTLFHHDLDL